MSLPRINSAIPQRRYQLGDFNLVVLSEIDSPDNAHFLYLMGIVPQGGNKPEMFISAERIQGGQQMRLIASEVSQTLEGGGPWNSVDDFSESALFIAKKLLNLEAEEPYQLQ